MSLPSTNDEKVAVPVDLPAPALSNEGSDIEPQNRFAKRIVKRIVGAIVVGWALVYLAQAGHRGGYVFSPDFWWKTARMQSGCKHHAERFIPNIFSKIAQATNTSRMSIKTHSDWAVQEMPDVWPLSKFATQQNGDLAPSMSFNFSAEKDFFVFLNGPLTPGVMVVHEDSFEAHSDIRVNMFAAKWTTESEQPLVRSLELYKGYVDDESVATALVVEPSITYHTNARYDIHISLPANRTGRPLSLHLNTPNMRTILSNIGETSAVEELAVHTSDSHVDAENVAAKHISVKTSNSPITGSFQTDDHLYLDTSNAIIDVNLGLCNRGAPGTSARMKTTNAALRATIDMTATDDERGTFSVSGKTTNGPVTALYLSSPGMLSLSSDFTSTNARAYIALPPAFEGTIYGKTSNHHPDLDYTGDISDPAGKGRHRSLQHDLGKSVVQGRIRWDGNDHAMGSSEVVTTNAPVYITV